MFYKIDSGVKSLPRLPAPDSRLPAVGCLIVSRFAGRSRLSSQMLSSRVVIFNVVGILGLGLQLIALWMLISSGVTLTLATLLAVELAVLHNFAWHQRWTWRDRPTTSRRGTAERLVRFHLANGAVSLVGSVVLTTLLVQKAGWAPLVANAAATIGCALVNYFASDILVFRASTIALALAFIPSVTARAEQPSAAIAGWDKHVSAVEKRFADASSAFALDVEKVPRWRERVKADEIVLHEVETPGVDDGKLHHWAGAIYIPHTTVQRVVDRLLEYAGRESEFYPEVKASRLIHRDGDRVRVYLRLYRDAGPVEATYNTEHAVEYRRAAARATARSVSTKIAELDKAGTPQEREKRPGEDNGFLWRLNAYWRYEQFVDGVLIECESVSLSRSVPWLIRPLANPIVDRIARESLRNTLTSLRAFLRRSP